MEKLELETIADTMGGLVVLVVMTDGTTQEVVLTGKITTKGLAYKNDPDEVTRYFARTKIQSVELADGGKDDTEHHDGQEEIESDDDLGMTTADLAVLFNTEAKALRVHLRAMGMGVGKGRRYSLTEEDRDNIREYFRQVNADA